MAQFPWTKEPSSPMIVVEGVNNTDVHLEWDYAAAVRPSILTVNIERKRDGTEKGIAIKGGQSSKRPSPLALEDINQDGREYGVLDPATLVLKEVNNDEEYEYVISVVYYPSSSSSIPSTVSKSVFVDVKGEEGLCSVLCFLFTNPCCNVIISDLYLKPDTVRESSSVGGRY